jgi:hypothetical protein
MMKAPSPNWESPEPLFCEEDIELLLQEYVEMKDEELKCECGSDSVGSPIHSSYCPKFERK